MRLPVLCGFSKGGDFRPLAGHFGRTPPCAYIRGSQPSNTATAGAASVTCSASSFGSLIVLHVWHDSNVSMGGTERVPISYLHLRSMDKNRPSIQPVTV